MKLALKLQTQKTARILAGNPSIAAEASAAYANAGRFLNEGQVMRNYNSAYAPLSLYAFTGIIHNKQIKAY